MKNVKKSISLIFGILILAILSGFHFTPIDIQTTYAETNKRIVGNFPDWESEKVDLIDYSKITDIIYFHIKPNLDGSLDTSDVDFNDLKTIRNRAHAQGVNVLIAVGGWGASDAFPEIAKNPALRENFVNKIESFIARNNLDGVDLDWETEINQEKIDNQDILLSDLSKVLHPMGKIVTVSVIGNVVELKSTAADYVDWVNIMAFNMNDKHINHSSFEDSISTLHGYENAGIPKEKLNLGIPFYGRISNGGGEISYEEIVSQCAPSPSDEYCNGYFFNGIDLVQQKSRHILHNDYGGIMIWSLAHDTHDQTSLLNAINEVFPNQPIPERKNPEIMEVKRTSNGILIIWIQEKPVAVSYDIFIDGIDTNNQFRTESSPQLVDYGKCFMVQARYSQVDLLSTEVCLEPELIPDPKPEPNKKIPDWVKNLMGWYAEDLIEEDEVISAIQFLIEKGIIKLD
ncbi:MAG: glycoside hydrolase family 18 protein [Nitrosopumilus sp.]|nr:glycoside hydrolase family 18 protein [Nitrosopumilus sp.]